MRLNYEQMSQEELYDLLANRTAEFLDLLAQHRPDPFKVRELKMEVEKIQQIISTRNGGSKVSRFLYR